MHWLNKSWYDYSLDPEDQINLTGRQCPSGDRGGQVKKNGKNSAMLIKKRSSRTAWNLDSFSVTVPSIKTKRDNFNFTLYFLLKAYLRRVIQDALAHNMQLNMWHCRSTTKMAGKLLCTAAARGCLFAGKLRLTNARLKNEKISVFLYIKTEKSYFVGSGRF